MTQTVIGFFDDAADAQKAVYNLTNDGFRREDIDTRDNTNRIKRNNDRYDSDRHDDDDSSITRFFKSLFGDNEEQTNRYTKVARNSCCLVAVHAQSEAQAERAAGILDSCGAIDVDERAQQYTTASAGQTHPATDRDHRNEPTETTISKVEEKLHVGRRVTDNGGGVRVRSRIVERPVEQQVRLREEHINVERQPVNRPVSAEDRPIFQDQEIEFKERKEVPIINKEARVVEEVRLSKEVTERQETIRDTVRHTEVDIDKIENPQDGRTTDRNDPEVNTR